MLFWCMHTVAANDVHLSRAGAIKLPNILDYMFFGTGPILADVSIIPRNFIKMPYIRNNGNTFNHFVGSGD